MQVEVAFLLFVSLKVFVLSTNPSEEQGLPGFVPAQLRPDDDISDNDLPMNVKEKRWRKWRNLRGRPDVYRLILGGLGKRSAIRNTMDGSQDDSITGLVLSQILHRRKLISSEFERLLSLENTQFHLDSDRKLLSMFVPQLSERLLLEFNRVQELKDESEKLTESIRQELTSLLERKQAGNRLVGSDVGQYQHLPGTNRERYDVIRPVLKLETRNNIGKKDSFDEMNMSKEDANAQPLSYLDKKWWAAKNFMNIRKTRGRGKIDPVFYFLGLGK